MKTNIKKIISVKDEAFFQQLGSHIAQLRQQKGLTQAELAAQLGLKHQQVLASYENAVRRLPSSLLLPLCEALNVSLDQLLCADQPKQKPGPVPKLQRQLQAVSTLPKSKQQFVSQFLETVLKAS